MRVDAVRMIGEQTLEGARVAAPRALDALIARLPGRLPSRVDVLTSLPSLEWSRGG